MAATDGPRPPTRGQGKTPTNKLTADGKGRHAQGPGAPAEPARPSSSVQQQTVVVVPADALSNGFPVGTEVWFDATYKPPHSKRGSWRGLTWVARSAAKASWFISLSRLTRDRDPGLSVYIVLWIAALTWVFGWLAAHQGATKTVLDWILLAGTVYRLQDMVCATADDALRLTDRFEDPIEDPNWRTPIVILPFHVVQTVLVFAIAYVAFLSSADFDVPTKMPTNWWESLYVSWLNLPPLGSNGPALGSRAGQALTMAEASVAFLLVVLALGAFVSGREKQG